jgi:hypothetical protein
MRTNPKGRAYSRDATRTCFLTDMQEDVAEAAVRTGLTATLLCRHPGAAGGRQSIGDLLCPPRRPEAPHAHDGSCI